MTLETLANTVFKEVMKPEDKKRKSSGLHQYIAPYETKEPYKNMWRISHAFDKPFEIQFMPEYNLPREVATLNLGMPLPIANYMQEMRNQKIDPTKQDHVAYFQDLTASVTSLFMPVVLSQILSTQKIDVSLDNLGIRVNFKHKNSGELLLPTFANYETIFSKDWEPRKISGVVTQGGSISQAKIDAFDLHKYIPILDFSGVKDLGISINFIDVQRAGTLPSMVGQWIANQMGFNADIWSVDAKRIPKDGGGIERIDIIPPIGSKG